MGTIWENHKTKIMFGCGGLTLLIGGICGLLVILAGGLAGFASGIVLIIGAGFFDEVSASASNPPSGPSFYEDVGGGDFDRLPFIEPYQAIRINDPWYMDLHENVLPFNKTGRPIHATVVNQSVIIIEAREGHEGARNIEGPVWYVIIPSQNIEKQFNSQVELDDYLQTQGIYSYNLESLDELYQAFVRNGRLAWFPTTHTAD